MDGSVSTLEPTPLQSVGPAVPTASARANVSSHVVGRINVARRHFLNDTTVNPTPSFILSITTWNPLPLEPLKCPQPAQANPTAALCASQALETSSAAAVGLCSMPCSPYRFAPRRGAPLHRRGSARVPHSQLARPSSACARSADALAARRLQSEAGLDARDQASVSIDTLKVHHRGAPSTRHRSARYLFCFVPYLPASYGASGASPSNTAPVLQLASPLHLAARSAASHWTVPPTNLGPDRLSHPFRPFRPLPFADPTVLEDSDNVLCLLVDFRNVNGRPRTTHCTLERPFDEPFASTVELLLRVGTVYAPTRAALSWTTRWDGTSDLACEQPWHDVFVYPPVVVLCPSSARVLECLSALLAG
ncbi:hypothetical protein G7046_g3486 [Stylonectria norvegica]|nr:hypothetical protein G7046_g3486 [Stylonectria norvegica]